MTCPVHGPGCFGIPEECEWIEEDMARRASEGTCSRCGAPPSNLCRVCSGEAAYDRSRVEAFEEDVFEATGSGLA